MNHHQKSLKIAKTPMFSRAPQQISKELRFARENHLPIFPVKLAKTYPPKPDDESGLGKIQNKFAFPGFANCWRFEFEWFL